ncbi:hypothetical protein GCM10027277_00230 [Pseudoduganella ginsengisoli]|uniref:Virulence sensor protein BvgS n=1 Tax=Pseudoduganella ginsengisoli TaxID=1462440 RepID=A0A6L6Q3N7_9BURK|nr:ATP-binding protein [Pseudoduganella ginsengisoli]MTW03911.1 response regulator [Pseudoduganella ginsengisoli]
MTPKAAIQRITAILRATTLRRQLSIAFALGMLMLALFGSLVSSIQSTRQVRQLLQAQGILAAETLAQGSQLALMYNASGNAATALRLALAAPDVLRVEIRTVDDRLLVGMDHDGNTVAPLKALDLQGDRPYLEDESSDAWSFVAPVTIERNAASPFEAAGADSIPLGYVRIVQSKATLQQMRTEIFRANFLISFFFALLFLWLIRFLTGRITAQLEQATREAQAASRAKSTFLASMSHEIRTPLNAVLGYAQLLEHDPQLPPALQANVAPITKAGNHLLHLLSDILDLSKIEAGQMALHATGFDLHALVDEVALLFVLRCRQKGLQWRCEKHVAAPCPVDGDAGKLRQVLINLLGNAVKFTEHGSVTLRVSAAHDGIRFDVADTGPGIAPEDQALVFEPFRQTDSGSRHGGTGLGLAIASRQVQMMGGHLALESRPTLQGACFTFTLPLAHATAHEAARMAAPSQAPLRLAPASHPALLVVDDNPDNRHILSAMLANMGASVQQAGSGDAALQMLRRQPADLVFMDIRMPGMDGMQTLARLRQEWGAAAPRCVAITASALAHETERYLAAGFDGFVAKPFLFSQIGDCLQRQLGVQFVAEDARAGAEARLEVPLKLSMPPRWHSDVATALDSGWASGVTALLEEMARVQPHARAFVHRVAALLMEFDMDAVRNELRKVHHE